MVARSLHLFWTCFLSISTSWSVAQTESGVSLIQAWQANAESIRNYDVSFRRWIGIIQLDQKAEDDNFSATEFVSTGRIAVDRAQGRILYVRETTVECDEKQTRNFESLEWNKGMETSLSDLSPIPNTVPKTFERFYKSRSIPIIEHCIAIFPQTLARASLEEDFVEMIRNYESSILLSQPDGSSTVSLQFANNKDFGVRVTFDPTSLMPTKCIFSELDPNSGAFLKVKQSGNPRYEKCKEIYRIISLEYNEPLFLGQDIQRDSVGTVQFTWHQFNEEMIHFPDNDGSPFGIEEAKKFLSIDNKEKVK